MVEAEDFAKMLHKVIREELVGMSIREGQKIKFNLVSGESFMITVEKDKAEPASIN